MHKMASLQFFFYFFANDFISLLLSLFLERKPFYLTKHQSEGLKDSVDRSPIALLCNKYNPICWIIIFHPPLFVTSGCWSWKKNHLWFEQTYTKFDRGRKKMLKKQHNNKTIIKSALLFSSQLSNQAFYLTSRVKQQAPTWIEATLANYFPFLLFVLFYLP